MSASAGPQLTVTVRTRLGQVLDLDLGEQESAEVHEALMQMLLALFEIGNPGNVRSVTFEITGQQPPA